MGNFNFFNFKKYRFKNINILLIATITFILGVFFKFQHWPGATIILLFGILLFLFAFLLGIKVSLDQRKQLQYSETTNIKNSKTIFNKGWRRIHISLSLVIYPIFIVAYFFYFKEKNTIEPPFINLYKDVLNLENNYIEVDIYIYSSIIIFLIYWFIILLFIWSKKGFLENSEIK